MKINLNSDRLFIYDFEVEVDVDVRHSRGNATYLEPGWHDITIKDWSFANRSKVEADLAEEIRITREDSDLPDHTISMEDIEGLVWSELRERARRNELD